jgi:hypothetical protein
MILVIQVIPLIHVSIVIRTCHAVASANGGHRAEPFPCLVSLTNGLPVCREGGGRRRRRLGFGGNSRGPRVEFSILYTYPGWDPAFPRYIIMAAELARSPVPPRAAVRGAGYGVGCSRLVPRRATPRAWSKTEAAATTKRTKRIKQSEINEANGGSLDQ